MKTIIVKRESESYERAKKIKIKIITYSKSLSSNKQSQQR